MRLLSIAFYLLFLCTTLPAQILNSVGYPKIDNFHREQFPGDAKIWSITQGPDGNVFFATFNGLFEYDGSAMRHHYQSPGQNLRAVFCSNDGVVYSAGLGGFGFWEKSALGGRSYTSIYNRQGSREEVIPEFWRIAQMDERIVFQSYKQLVIYNPETAELEYLDAPTQFSFMFSSKGRVFVEDQKRGLFELQPGRLKPLEGTDLFNGSIIGVQVLGTRMLNIYSSDKGVWSWNRGELKKENWPINQKIKSAQLFAIEELADGGILLATVRKGVYHLDEDGNTLLHIDKSKGLQKNTVLSVFQDKNHNMWLGLDGGLDYLRQNSMLRYLFDEKAEMGSVYATHRKDKQLYIGSNQGLYVKDLIEVDAPISFVEDTEGQVWNLQEIDGSLVVGHHKGLMLMEGGSLRLAGENLGGAWLVRKNPRIENLMYVGHYFGISIFQKEGDHWVFSTVLNDFSESSRFMEFDKYGNLWVAHPSKGYFRLRLDETGTKLEEKEYYEGDQENIGLPAYLCKLDGDVIFNNRDGFFRYDPLKNAFLLADYPSQLLQGKHPVQVKQFGDLFWYYRPGELGFVKRRGDQLSTLTAPFDKIREYFQPEFGHISMMEDDIFALGIEEGIAFCHPDLYLGETVHFKPQLRAVQFIGASDTLRLAIEPEEEVNVRHSNNYVKFEVTLPGGEDLSPEFFQFRLKGLSEEWTDWRHRVELKFPGLGAGNYRLQLRIKEGNSFGAPQEYYAFTVSHPFYLSYTARAIYLLAVVLISFMIRVVHRRKTRKEQERIQRREKEKRRILEAELEKENLKAEKQLHLAREEKYKVEIDQKNNELASSTMNNIRKNELLNDLKTQVTGLKKQNSVDGVKRVADRILRKLDSEIKSQDDWLTFELHFNNAHGNFFDKIRADHPDLTAKDLRLCAYLKLNLSSKEIASLLNISDRSVEVSRYRLRKKLELNKEQNLVAYIGSY